MPSGKLRVLSGQEMPRKRICYTPYKFLPQGEITMHTYRALLRGDRLEWLGEAPESQTEAPLSVQVIILEQELSLRAAHAAATGQLC